MDHNTETDWIDVFIADETDKAWLMDNGQRDAWIPKSQVVDSEDELKVAIDTRVELPVWLLERSELV